MTVIMMRRKMVRRKILGNLDANTNKRNDNERLNDD